MRPRSQLTLLWVLAALFTTPCSGVTSARNKISYAQDRLSAHVVEVSLEEVLSAVSKEVKLEFVLNEAIAAKKVSVSFDKLPLEKGIKRIIRPLSCSMIFDASGKLKKVIILKSGSRSANITISGGHDSEPSGPSSSQEDFDPTLGPAGRMDEGPPPSAPGPRQEGDMTDLPQDFDPTLGPAGRMDEGPPPSAPGPRQEGEMVVSPEIKYPTPLSKGP